MCLVGLVGPAIGILGWRAIGIAGYAVVFPLTCVALARAFLRIPAHRQTHLITALPSTARIRRT